MAHLPDRRDFLKQAGGFLLLPYAVGTELRCDIAIIGGGFGGVAATLAALRNGRRVVLTEETDWIGGQVTSQAVPPDEHSWIESFGCTRGYRTYRDAVRLHTNIRTDCCSFRAIVFRSSGSAVSRKKWSPGNMQRLNEARD